MTWLHNNYIKWNDQFWKWDNDSRRDEVLLHKEGRDSAQVPQKVMMGPVEEHVQHLHPVVFPRGWESRRPIAKITQTPRPMGQCGHHIRIRLPHLEKRWSQSKKCSKRKFKSHQKQINWIMLPYRWLWAQMSRRYLCCRALDTSEIILSVQQLPMDNR